MRNWIKPNWSVDLLTLIVRAAVTVMVLTMIENSETLRTEVGYAIMAMTVAVVVFLILALKRPDKVTALRVDLI